MNMKDIVVSGAAYGVLYANGKSDCDHGISMYDGWQEVAKIGGYTSNSRTPAREAYEDGYYAGKFGSLKPTEAVVTVTLPGGAEAISYRQDF